MKLVIRVKNEETKRYKRVDSYDTLTFLRDSENFPADLHGVPVLIDSIFADGGFVCLSVTPAWNRKRQKA